MNNPQRTPDCPQVAHDCDLLGALSTGYTLGERKEARRDFCFLVLLGVLLIIFAF